MASTHWPHQALHPPLFPRIWNGFGDAPETVAETIQLAAETGLVGCTIEDATGNQDSPLYDLPLAVERIAAAVQAGHAGFRLC